MTANLDQGFPQISVPLQDPETGALSIAWYQFFRALWVRTGSSGGAASGVAEIDTGAGLTGGPINAGNPIGVISLENVGANDILANITGGAAAPVGTPINDVIDHAFGSTQGDILYRGLSQWTTLAPGTNGQFLQTQGGSANPHWANKNSLLNIQYFTSPGTSTYTPTAGTNQCFAWAQAGGGGGGGSPSVIAAHAALGGPGGGGEYREGFFAVGTLSGLTVTVGGGGGGGSAGANAGTAGSDSSIGGVLVAKGGGAGTAGVNINVFPGVSGASATGGSGGSGGSLSIPGGDGLTTILLSSTLANNNTGGRSRYSMPSDGQTTGGGAGVAATGFGGGGTGGLTVSGGGTAAGGAGSGGAVVIMEFT